MIRDNGGGSNRQLRKRRLGDETRLPERLISEENQATASSGSASEPTSSRRRTNVALMATISASLLSHNTSTQPHRTMLVSSNFNNVLSGVRTGSSANNDNSNLSGERSLFSNVGLSTSSASALPPLPPTTSFQPSFVVSFPHSTGRSREFNAINSQRESIIASSNHHQRSLSPFSMSFSVGPMNRNGHADNRSTNNYIFGLNSPLV